MKHLFNNLRERPLMAVVVAACGFALVGAGVAAASVSGWPTAIFAFASPSSQVLPADKPIAGWAAADDDSHFIGDTFTYSLHVLYRPEAVTPDIDLLERSVSFLPFETLGARSSERALGDGVTEFTIEFTLQAIDVVPSTAYPLDSVLVYYEPAGVELDELETVRIARPAVSVASYYPDNVAQVPLQPVKGEIGDHTQTRQIIMAVSGGVLLVLAIFLLWASGRKRRIAEMSEPERLWQQMHEMGEQEHRSRDHLLGLEKIFTHLLDWRTQTTPGAFWAGVDPAEPAEWTKASADARQLLSKVYQAEEPTAEDVAKGHAILDAMLTPLVDEARMRRDNQPAAWQRLMGQPGVLAVSGVSAAAAVAMFVLAAQPQHWLSPDLMAYNRAVVRTAASEEAREDAPAVFLDLAERVGSGVVKAAALYNSGTISARLPATWRSDFGEAEIMYAVFQDEEPIQTLLDDQESIDNLVEAGVSLGLAVRNLQAAIRMDRTDEDTRKNLELAGKRHRAVIASIQKLFDVGSPLNEAQQEALVDVLNMKMPDEFMVEDKGKDNSNYLIMERF